MRGASAARCAAITVVMTCALAAAARGAPAQSWNDARTRALVERATARRAAQIADPALASYTATANGYVTFLGQVGEGLRTPPKILRTDQLAVEVYWRAPALSKQVIIGRRDTLLLPTDIRYHMDHLGVVQNNFPSIIRIGEGDEVKDVPHPLSAAGLADYDFAITDSLRIRLGERRVDVFEVQLRPKDPSQPRVVGAVYLDTATAQVVRMNFSFTRAAYLDAQLEDISIVLENALVEGRFWLPFRQEVEIRRRGTWMDFPARGIIRGRWEICCYTVNATMPVPFFTGPEIVMAPPNVRAQYPWKGNVLDSLPEEARVATDADVARVQEEVRERVASRALAPRTGASLYTRRVSDFVRVNRVEGIALGAGGAWHATPSLDLDLLARYGFADQRAKARLALDWRPGAISLAPFAEYAYREAGDVQERSLVVNSLAAQEYGSDFTDPYAVSAAGLRAGLGTFAGVRVALTGSYEAQRPLEVHATSFRFAYGPTLPAWTLDEWHLVLRADRDWVTGPSSDVRAELSVSGGWLVHRDSANTGALARWGRAFAAVSVDQAIGRQHLVLRTTIGAVTDGAPAQDQVLLGGPITGPGYGFHQFAAALGGSQHVEWRMPLPFFRVPIGAYGRTPASFTLAPYAHVVYVDGSASFAQPAEGWYPSLGVGASFFFDLLRLDAARGLRDGTWFFGVDLAHDLWSIL